MMLVIWYLLLVFNKKACIPLHDYCSNPDAYAVFRTAPYIEHTLQSI
jgi:hypothetical protein